SVPAPDDTVDAGSTVFEDGTPAATPSDRAPVDVPSLSTAYSDTTLIADGMFDTRVYPAPVNFKGLDGSWVPIDTTFVADASATGYVHEAENAIGVRVAPFGDSQDLVKITYAPGESTTWSLPGAGHVPAVVQGSSVTFANILPDEDLVVRNLG